MSDKQQLNSKPVIGCVPRRLEIKDSPKYDNFPCNLMFLGFAVREGEIISATAIYLPDFSTFQEKDDQQSMVCFNKYSRDWRVEIIYDTKRKS